MKSQRTKPYIIAPLILFLFVTTAAGPAWGKDVWRNVDRVVAIGDIHGDYEQYLTILRDSGLIDARLNWAGGKTHLVQMGDLPDRGPDSLKIMQHMKKLQKQARREKGYVHALIGNHEIMNVDGDLRYVHPGEFTILANKKSAKRQKDYITSMIEYLDNNHPEAALVGESRRPALEKIYPLGYVEHRRLWAPRGEFFEWIKSHNTAIKINRTLFVHGGLSPHQTPLPLKEINTRVRRYLRTFDEDTIVGNGGPLWYRGLALNSAEVELEPLKNMLAFYDVDTIVIAHTPTPSRIVPRLGRRVIQADVGLSRAYTGGRASLVIEGDKYYAIHRGTTVTIPAEDSGKPAYLATLSAIDENDSQQVEE